MIKNLIKKLVLYCNLNHIQEKFFFQILIFVITLLVSINSFNNPFILDDLGKIVENTDLRIFDHGFLGSFEEIKNFFNKLIYPYQNKMVLERNDPSRPLVFFVYTMIYQIDGINPFYFHLFNVIFHAFNGIFVFLITRKILVFCFKENASFKSQIKKKLSKNNIISGKVSDSISNDSINYSAFLVSLFFVISPIQMGTVIYIYGLSDVLSTFFVLSSVYFFIRNEVVSLNSKIISSLCMVFALLSKQSSFVIPFIILLFDIVFISQFNIKILNKRFFNYIPFCLIAFLYILIRWSYFGGIGDLEAQSRTYAWTEYFLTQPVAILRYIGLTFYPHGLAIDHYVFPTLYSFIEKILAFFILTLSFFLICYICGDSFFKRLKTKFTPHKKIIFFGFVFYIFCIAPTSSFIPTVDIMVERRVYLANFGIFLMFIAIYDCFFKNSLINSSWNFKKYGKNISLLICYLCILTTVTTQRNHLFDDPEKVWENILEQYPLSPRANNNVANIYFTRKKFEQSKQKYLDIVFRDPRDPYGYSNLGTLYAEESYSGYDLIQAISYFQKALEINPMFFESLYGMGRAYQKLGHQQEAEKSYRKVLEIYPGHALAHNNLGLLYMHQGKKELAHDEFTESLKYDPNSIVTKNNFSLLKNNRFLANAQPQVNMIPLEKAPNNAIIPLCKKILLDPHAKTQVAFQQCKKVCLEKKLDCGKIP